MAVNERDIEQIVRNVLSELTQKDSAQLKNDDSKTARVAMLTGEKKIEVKSFPIPQIKDDEILVKVEGCGVCGTDVHEWKFDPFKLIPVVLGHEGTGEIIAIGKNIRTDTIGNPLKIGDKVVSSAMVCGKCGMCHHHPDKPNLCEDSAIYGLLPDDDIHLNGWFATHIILRKGSTVFLVNGMSLEERMLIELATVAVHCVERARNTNIMNVSSVVLVQGVGPVGQMVTAVLAANGIGNIIALDGDHQRLEMAKQMGASHTINFKELKTLDERNDCIKSLTKSLGVDFAFQCTGVPSAAAEIWKYVRRGGGLCEVGFFVDNGNATINPHYDICRKEITVVGSWVYYPSEYPLTISFIKRAKTLGIPVEKLVTHRFGLDEMNEAMDTNVAMKGIKVAFVNK